MSHLDPILIIILAGALGAFTSELLRDNCVELPKKIGARFSLGIIGSIIVGAIAGYYVDGSPETAFMAGFMGPQLLSAILKKKSAEFLAAKTETPVEIEAAPAEKPAALPVAPEEKPIFADIVAMIRWKAARAGVSPDLAVAVARAESNLKSNVININPSGSKDRGLYQWNDKYHPDVTDAMAFDPEKATDLFLEAVKNGHLSWWSASQAGWGTYA